ncbi:hypothetical protein SADUNF_Sadunf03G0157100 [Salix dunnii]|uniref:Uncharacterized protein n=1 Tax=Salix dunnii TaxID=1413687 RepID=A0A835N527_9ROSI|nr:hypothetical protein SADUNF_Sadunf03G0157100 [Salix dunnii]
MIPSATLLKTLNKDNAIYFTKIIFTILEGISVSYLRKVVGRYNNANRTRLIVFVINLCSCQSTKRQPGPDWTPCLQSRLGKNPMKVYSVGIFSWKVMINILSGTTRGRNENMAPSSQFRKAKIQSSNSK